MATITRYVNTAAAGGGDGTTNGTGAGGTNAFATLAAAEAALRQDLTDSGGDVLEIICEGSTADTGGEASFGIANWTTSATCYVHIKVLQANRHDGKWNTGKYRLTTTNTNGITFNGVYGTVEGVQVQVTQSGASSSAAFAANGTCTVYYDACIAKGNDNTDTAINAGFYSGWRESTSARYRNCIAYGFGGNTLNRGFSSDADENWVIAYHNCTAYDCYYGFFSDHINAAPGAIYKNCLAAACDDGYYWGGATPSGNNNASTLASDVPGTAGQNSATAVFVNAASGDLHLAAGDTAINNGADLSGDSNYAVTLDIDGTTRYGTWDIGADEKMSKISTFTDNFNDNSLDSGKWTPSASGTGSEVTETGGTLNLTHGNLYQDYAQVVSVVAWDFASSEVYVKVHTYAGDSFTQMEVYDSGNDGYMIGVRYGTYRSAVFYRLEAGSGVYLGETPGYHIDIGWLKLAESGGTVTAYYALTSASDPPATGDWTSFDTDATYASMDTANCYVELRAATNTGTGGPQTDKFDGFNTSASGGGGPSPIAGDDGYMMLGPSSQSITTVWGG